MAPLQIAAADGLAIVVTRHERKAGGDVGDSGRGSTAFGGAVDIILAIRRIDGTSNARRVYGLSRFDETPDVFTMESTATAMSLSARTARSPSATPARASSRSCPPIHPWPYRCGRSDGPKSSRPTLQRALDPSPRPISAARTGAETKGNPYRRWAPIETRSGGEGRRSRERRGRCHGESGPTRTTTT